MTESQPPASPLLTKASAKRTATNVAQSFRIRDKEALVGAITSCFYQLLEQDDRNAGGQKSSVRGQEASSNAAGDRGDGVGLVAVCELGPDAGEVNLIVDIACVA